MSQKKPMGKTPAGGEHQLPASEANYRTLFDSIDEGFVVAELLFDKHGKPCDLLVLETNASFDRMMRTKNAVGKRALEIFPNVESSWFEAYGRVVETGQSLRFENYLADLDGWFDLYISRMNQADSHIIVIVFNDITKRKKAERELKRTKELLQATLDSSLEDIQLLKAVRDETGAIVDFVWAFTNKTWNEKWGDMTGRSLLEENPAVIETGLFDKFVSVTESGIPTVYEQFYPHEQFNGWFLQSLVKVGDGFLTTTLDITERKLAEEALRESEARLARELEDTRQLQQISTELIQEENIEALYQQILNAAIILMRADMGSLQMFDPERQELRLLAWQGFHPESAAYWATINSESPTVCGRALGAGERQIVSDLNSPDFVTDDENLRQFRLSGIQAVQSTPLVSRDGRPVGMLSTHWREPHVPGEHKWKLFDVLARQAADVLERTGAEEAIRQSEERYRTLFNSIDEGFCIVEVLFDDDQHPQDYRFLDINASFEKQTGIINGFGRSMREIEPRHEDYWFELYGKVALTGESVRFTRYAEYLGNRWYDVYAFHIGEPHEHKVGILFNDVTERKHAEERQTFLLKLSDALRSLDDPIGIQDAVTHEAMRYFGADRCYYCEIESDDAVIRRDAFRGDLPSVAGTYPLSSFPILKAVITAGRPFIVQDVHATDLLDDALRQLCIQLQVISFVNVPIIKQGTAAGVFCLVQSEPRNWTGIEVDLAVETAERIWAAVERTKAEVELRGSEERLRLIIESARGYAIFTTDDGGYINSWGMGAAHIFGWSESEILGQNSAVLFTPEDRATGEHKKELETARTQGIAPDIRWHQRKDGSRVFINGEVRPLSDGQQGGFAKIGRDMTAQRQAEEALRENQKQLQLLNETLEQQIQEKTSEVRQVASELVKATQQERHRISHLLHDDLQQNIYAIQMQMTFLSNLLKDGQEAARKEAMAIADQLNEVLEMTRQLSIDLSPPILRGEGLWHAINWLAGRMQQRYEFSIELQAEGSFVIPDEELHVLLFNCVRELLFNVVKHAKATRAVVVLKWIEDQKLLMEVQDNGKGFNPDTVAAGTGHQGDMPQSLGLPTIRHQLALFGGQMEIHSTLGAGTQVIIVVPVVRGS